MKERSWLEKLLNIGVPTAEEVIDNTNKMFEKVSLCRWRMNLAWGDVQEKDKEGSQSTHEG